MATANGTVKKTPLEQFSRPRSSGLIALELEEGNTLVGVALTDGRCDVLLIASSGKAVRFKESDVRAMGRTARGVRGIRLGGGHHVISLIIPQENGYVLTASQHGYGKRTHMDEFPVKGRGTQGVIGMQTTRRNGGLIGAVQVFDGDEIMLISNLGTLVRTKADEVSQLGRNTQGVRLINLRGDEHLVGVQRIVESEDEDNGIGDGDGAVSDE
jgi:DNA gyrase subunit A